MMIKKFVEWFFSDEDPIKGRYKIYCYDQKDSDHSLIELLDRLEGRIQVLENKVEKLVAEISRDHL